jgi:cytoskeletal protein CcmA (bactofilin family)
MQIFSSNRKPAPAIPAVQPEEPITRPRPEPSDLAAVAPQSGDVLSSGVSITGSVKFAKQLLIDGEVKGNIESTGILTIGKHAQIRAQIRTKSVTVQGTVEGNIFATERCELQAGSTLRGDVEAPRLSVDENATFLGSAKITGVSRPSS